MSGLPPSQGYGVPQQGAHVGYQQQPQQLQSQQGVNMSSRGGGPPIQQQYAAPNMPQQHPNGQLSMQQHSHHGGQPMSQPQSAQQLQRHGGPPSVQQQPQHREGPPIQSTQRHSGPPMNQPQSTQHLQYQGSTSTQQSQQRGPPLQYPQQQQQQQQQHMGPPMQKQHVESALPNGSQLNLQAQLGSGDNSTPNAQQGRGIPPVQQQQVLGESPISQQSPEAAALEEHNQIPQQQVNRRSVNRRQYPNQMETTPTAPQGGAFAQAPETLSTPNVPVQSTFFVPGAGPAAPLLPPSAAGPVPNMAGATMNGVPMQPTSSTMPTSGAQGAHPAVYQSTSSHGPGNSVNLLSNTQNIIPPAPDAPRAAALPEDRASLNCHPRFMRFSVAAVPQTQSLLTKSKLPIGLHVFPFASMPEGQELPVISGSIVRCRSCRTYINPFVAFVDNGRRWRCNMCHLVNEIPTSYDFHPKTRAQIDRNTHKELTTGTVEYIAPDEYMVRPPQPTTTLFLIDVSYNAVETGMLETVAGTIRDVLQRDVFDGDARTRVGFITFDSHLHFYNLRSTLSQPQQLVVSDLDDVFLPSPNDLLVNRKECSALVDQLLDRLPAMFGHTRTVQSCLGPALQAAFKLIAPTGGRISVFQASLPSTGPVGQLKMRESSSSAGTAKEFENLLPATDFYKQFAVDCSSQQIGVDVALFSGQYTDVATLSCLAKHSSGTLLYYPDFHSKRNPDLTLKVASELSHILSRPLGLEAVMRVRCTQGITIHTFHGNFFVRSTDLLALPTVSPDNSFGMQYSIEDKLQDLLLTFRKSATASFQTALLYTTSHGQRRIRVHNINLPIAHNLNELYSAADAGAVISLLGQMAVDRALSTKLTDAREALLNICIDVLSIYKTTFATSSQANSQLIISESLRLLPLLVNAMLKNPAFRIGSGTSLDQRAYAMGLFKTLPIDQVIDFVYPRLYALHQLSDSNAGLVDRNTGHASLPPQLHLSGQLISKNGIFLAYNAQQMIMIVCRNVSSALLHDVFGVSSIEAIPNGLTELQDLDNENSFRIRNIIAELRLLAPALRLLLHVAREDDSRVRAMFSRMLVDDRDEQTVSYHEWISHLMRQVSSK